MSDTPATQAKIAETQQCIDDCLECYELCQHMAMSHCLEQGGKHTDPKHFRLMINCATVCRTAAEFMLSESGLHGPICAACAEVCSACARSCKELGDMERCVQACERCVESCRKVSESASLSPFIIE